MDNKSQTGIAAAIIGFSVICIAVGIAVISSRSASSGPPNQPGSRAREKVSVQGEDGQVKVRITKTRLDYTVYYDIIGQMQVDNSEKNLFVYLDIENHSETQKVEYEGWHEKHSGVSLKDELGNSYAVTQYPYGSRIQWGGPPVMFQIMQHSIHPRKVVSDIIVFQRPVQPAKMLQLELPARNFGGSKRLRFEIPTNSIIDDIAKNKPMEPNRTVERKEALAPKSVPNPELKRSRNGVLNMSGYTFNVDKMMPDKSPYPECEVILADLRASIGEGSAVEIVSWGHRSQTKRGPGRVLTSAFPDGTIEIELKYRVKNKVGALATYRQTFGCKDGKVIKRLPPLAAD